MKKFIWVFLFLILAFPAWAQKAFIQQSLVVNVEVPVRVFDGDSFVDSLTIDDFEVLEDGVSQKIEAVYLIKRRDILHREGKAKETPRLERSFFFFFEVAEYMPKIGEAMTYFFDNVLLPDDNLTFVTPLSTYMLKAEAFRKKSREQIVSEMKGIIRRDAWEGNAESRHLFHDIEKTSQLLAATLAAKGGREDIISIDPHSPYDKDTLDLNVQLAHFQVLVERLENLRIADQYKMIDFARHLKTRRGRKYVFVFYGQEFIPFIDPRILQKYIHEYQGEMTLVMKLSELEGLSNRGVTIDMEPVRRAYADSATAIHFILIRRHPQPIIGVRMEDRSEDVFGVFYQLAQATGGIALTSSNPAASFEKAVEASENYYLLYYSPKDYVQDGTFRKIEVRVPGKSYRVHHRSGYFAN